MATVIAVHGTYAHAMGETGTTASTNPADLQWWQAGSSFENDMRELVDAVPGMGSGKLEVSRFVWSGDNSEVERRAAGTRLLQEMRQLEARQEPYCVVGHSHGGSVIGWALLESSARKQPLNYLKRWITVGTPFVSLKREHFLFARLDLMRKVAFVASFMLLFMFLVYLGTDLISGRRLIGGTFPMVLAVTATLMSLPIIFFYVVLKYLDSRALLHYRRSVKARAGETFSARWLPLTHTDDEAVQGLAFLPGAKLYFFDKTFAVSALTMLSVFALPLIYLLILTSPSIMTGVADMLKTHVYDSKHDAAEKALLEARARLRQKYAARGGAAASTTAPAAGTTDRQAWWSEYRSMRQELLKRFPDLRDAERSLRFKQRFFEEQGKPCEGGQLCGAGGDIRINSALLLHLVTDELA